MSKEKIFFLSFAVLTFVIYGQSLFGSFVFDDRGIIEHKELLSSLANLKEVALYPYWTEEAGLYRPTTLLSYAFNIIFLGGSAFSFHLLNIILYIGICVSIYLLVKRLFRDEWLAYLSALIFLVLPIHTEVVANISGRSELLALFFSLLLLLEFTSERVNYWRASLWMFLAIGAKETAIAATLLALIVLYIREGKVTLELVKKYFTPVSAVVIGAVVYFFLRFFVLGSEHFLGVETSLIENPLLFADTSSRIFTALSILWMYVSKSFWPVNLCSDYSYNQIPVISDFLRPTVLLGFSVFAGAIVAIFIFLKRQPIVSFGAAIFVSSFFVVSNFLFPIGTIAGERLFFFPSLGLALIVALALSKVERKTFTITILAIYAIISLNRQSVWMSEEKLFLNAVECAPNSVLSLSNAGASYYLAGDLEKAQPYLELSREIKPIYSKGLNNLGLVYWKQGNDKDALRLYHEALTQKYPYSGAIENLILLYLSRSDKEGALRWLRIAYPNADDSSLRSLF